MDSYATGNVIGSGEYIGGLVGDAYGTIEDSFATGDVTGTGVEDVAFHGIGGLIGYLGGYLNNSYATGVVRGFAEIGGLVGSLGGGGPYISNSHASGDVYGEEFVGGLVGYLDNVSQSISNAYATGDVTGQGYYIGGLVGASYGYIQNSYATGDVTGLSYVGGLTGALFSSGSIVNSFATGDVDASGTPFDNFIGFVSDGSSVDGISRAFSKSSPDAPSILSVVNVEGISGAPAFEIVVCKNNGLPLLSVLSNSYANTCLSSRWVNDFIQTTSITEISETLGFVISPKFPNDASIGFIKNEKELAISKISFAQKAAYQVARTFINTGEALQISYDFKSKDPVELWVYLADGKWLLAGVIVFDKNGKAVLPPIQFKVAGEHLLVLNKPSEDSVKANAPLNQIGSLTVFVN
jgi:hypothetical protein